MSAERPDDAQGVHPPWAHSDRRVPRRVVRPIQAFMHQEASGGLVLLIATAVALCWANVAPSGYADLWSNEITVSIAGQGITESLAHVVNDGLMAIFFLVIGLEVKREISIGELSSRQAALLPACAALGGMVVPAVIFVAITGGGPDGQGWGIPMATDVAFALAAVAVLGRRVPVALTAFLLGVAVIDDIGAVIVVAINYSDGLQVAWIALAAAGLTGMWALRHMGVRHLAPYIVLGFMVWFATFQSGVHATIAGVAIGLLTPAHAYARPHVIVTAAQERLSTIRTQASTDVDVGSWLHLSWLTREAVSPVDRLIHALHPWSSFVVLPLFALANAGIALDRDALSAAVESPVALAVGLGLVVGKTLGLTGGAFLAVQLRLASLPRDTTWGHIAGVGAIAGIGFTVSLFIAELAYADPATVSVAKIGILGGSITAAVVGMLLLMREHRRQK